MKEFNVTGVCVPNKHYMVDISKKLDQIIKLIENEKYFTINRARQYGKTTTLSCIYKALKDKYLVLKISFEGIGDYAFTTENAFIGSFINLISRRLYQNGLDNNIISNWEENKNELNKLEDLSLKITELVENTDKEIVLMIDEVDKSSNNQLFLHFLGMLRNKYLDREEGLDSTFKSVILAGVYDVKNLKLKLRADDEKKYNSPWNIATDFDVDMSFNSEEISTMLMEYEKDYKAGIDIEKISKEIYKFTSGYPFLTSKICKIIHEKLNQKWSSTGVKDAVKLIVNEKTTLSDDLIKNLANNSKLYESIYNQLILGEEFAYNAHNEITQIGTMLGVFRKEEGKRIIHNKIFEELIYEYMASEIDERERLTPYNFRSNFISKEGELSISTILEKFQQMMKEEYSNRDKDFLEREGRLLFIAFLRPIINGIGFALKEVQISEERRLDILITYNQNKYVIELKRWYGEEYHKKGLKQLNGYLENQGLSKGYLVIFDFRKEKEYKKGWIDVEGKKIYKVVV